MSLALYASIAIRLDAREGEWVPVRDLSKHLGLSDMAVRQACKMMQGNGLLETRLAEGHSYIEAVRTPATLLHGGAA